MPTSDINLSHAFTLEPKDAVAYFRQKGYNIGWNWQDVATETHAKAFTVAKAARLDILEAIRKDVDKALSDGITEREFTNTLTPRLQKLGWWGRQIIVDSKGAAQSVQLGSPWRLRTIYQANVQSAYMVGRYKQQLENSDARPYWMYVAVLDANTRPSHGAMNGKVFHYTDPVWRSHYPPNGWNCRCRVRALSERRLKSLGAHVISSEGKLSTRTVESGFDQRTGEVYTHEVITYKDGNQGMTPDAGWSQNLGELAYGTDMALMQKITPVQDVELRTQVVQSINNSALRHEAFANWVDRVLDQKRAGHSAQAIGFVDEAVAAAVAERTGKVASRLLVINEKQLVHADSKKHEIGGVSLNREEIKILPVLLADYDAVFWDKKHNNLMYVRFDGEGAMVMLPVNPSYYLKKKKARLDVLMNAFGVEDRRVFDNENRFERLR